MGSNFPKNAGPCGHQASSNTSSGISISGLGLNFQWIGETAAGIVASSTMPVNELKYPCMQWRELNARATLNGFRGYQATA